MSNIEACLFDLDGVLVDTAKYHYFAWNKIARELGIQFTLKDNEELKGLSRLDSLEKLLQIGKMRFDSHTKSALANKKNSFYLQYISAITPKDLLPGSMELLLLLRDNNYKIGLCSSSKNSMGIIKKLNIIDFFNVIIDGNKVNNPKPDPEIFLKAAEYLKVKPNNCVVFEDSKAGIQAAKNGKMFTIGVGDSNILNKADLVISGLDKVTLNMLTALGG